MKLESWLADWFNKDLYNRREQIAGGKPEQGNGLEIWRQLFRQYACGTDVVNFGGQMRLKDCPKGTNVAHLEVHLDAWKRCLDEFGTELYATPGILRTIFMGILPDEIEKEILDRPELAVGDYKTVLDWVKVRLEHKR